MKKMNILKKNSGRDTSGQVSVRHQGGRHKRFYRSVDFRRDKFGIVGTIVDFEYDPNRSSDLALVHYTDGEKRYILRPVNLNIGDKITSSSDAEVRVGNALPLERIPVGTMVHNVELTPGRGGQLARSAGDQIMIMAREGNFVHLKLPSGEIRKVHGRNYATIGQIGNVGRKDRVLGKAGKSRHMGIRPQVRGVAMNPRSHPHGGGEARSGIGMSSPKTYAGRIAVGKTRKHKKYSDKYIISKRVKHKKI